MMSKYNRKEKYFYVFLDKSATALETTTNKLMCTGVATGNLELQGDTPVCLTMVQLDYGDEIKNTCCSIGRNRN